MLNRIIEDYIAVFDLIEIACPKRSIVVTQLTAGNNVANKVI